MVELDEELVQFHPALESHFVSCTLHSPAKSTSPHVQNVGPTLFDTSSSFHFYLLSRITQLGVFLATLQCPMWPVRRWGYSKWQGTRSSFPFSIA